MPSPFSMDHPALAKSLRRIQESTPVAECIACHAKYEPLDINAEPVPYLPRGEDWRQFHACPSCLCGFIDFCIAMNMERGVRAFMYYAPVVRQASALRHDEERTVELSRWAESLASAWGG